MISNQNKKASPLTRFMSILICIVVTVICLAFFSIITARFTLSEDAIRGNFASVNFARLHVGGMLNLDDAYPHNIELAEFIFDELDPHVVALYSITRQNIEDAINHMPVSDFIENILIRYGQGLLQGSGSINISPQEILSFIQQNDHHIYSGTGIQFTQADYDVIEQLLFDSDIHSITHLDSILDDVGLSMSVPRWALSGVSAAVLGVAALALLVVVFFMYGKRISPTLMCCGCSLAVSGLLFFALSVGANPIVAMVIPIEIDRVLISALLLGFQRFGASVGAVSVGVGVVLVVASIGVGVFTK